MNRQRRIVAVVLVAIGVLAMLYIFQGKLLGIIRFTPHIPDPLPADSILQTDEKVKKLSFTIPLDNLPEGQSYHVWLVVADNTGYKYAGSMFAVQGGKYSITFTTEEGLDTYRVVVVSQEATDTPEKPSIIVKEYVLQK